MTDSMIRFSLRPPKSLHEKLKKMAEAEGVLLNQYMIYTLACEAGLQTELVLSR